MSKIEETNSAINDPEFLGDLCAHVSTTGTLVSFCNGAGLDYKLVNRWIHDNGERAKRYKLALDMRDDHAKDLIIAELIAYLSAKVTDAFVRIDGVEGGAPSRQALKDIEDMPSSLQRLIASVKFEEIFEWQGTGKDRERVHVGRMHEIKFWDKPRSVETYMKHLSMLIDRKEIKGSLSLADLIAGEVKGS